MAKRKDYQLAATKTFAVEKDSYELLLKNKGVLSGEVILAKEKLIAIDPTTKALLVKWVGSAPEANPGPEANPVPGANPAMALIYLGL